jgi:hypothetical protein
MKKSEIALPFVALFAITRALGGAGVALLLGDKLGANKMKIGRMLFGIGLLSTVPLAYGIFGPTIRQNFMPQAQQPQVFH